MPGNLLRNKIQLLYMCLTVSTLYQRKIDFYPVESKLSTNKIHPYILVHAQLIVDWHNPSTDTSPLITWLKLPYFQNKPVQLPEGQAPLASHHITSARSADSLTLINSPQPQLAL